MLPPEPEVEPINATVRPSPSAGGCLNSARPASPRGQHREGVAPL